MQIDGYVQALHEDLLRVAAVGDESTGRAAELLSLALESSVARRLQEVLAEAALELTGQLEGGHVEVRIAGGDTQLVVVREGEPEPQADSALDARITLRLPEALKQKVEDAASRAGISVNTWIVRALSRESGAPRSSGGSRNRLTGYGRS
jgi:hypothetical protein